MFWQLVIGRDVNRLKNYLWIDLKIMFRIPLSIFFSMGYPIVMMVIILLSYGNVSIGNGYHLVDKYFMISMGMGILPLTLISFPMWIGNSFENSSMQRMIYFGVKMSKMVVGDILAHLILALISMTINIIFAFCFFGLKFPPIMYFIAFILQYILAVIIFMIIGGVIALIFKNTQILLPFGLVIMFVLYMFCGVFIEFDKLPSFFRNVANFIPMKYAMNDFYDIWSCASIYNEQFLQTSSVYLLIFSIILVILIKANGKKHIRINGGKL